MITRLTCLGSVAVLALSLTPVQAADIYAPPSGGLKDGGVEETIIPEAHPYEETADWYVRGSLGINRMTDPSGSGDTDGSTYDVSGYDFDTVYSFSGGFGRYLTPRLRMGLDAEYRHSSETYFGNDGIAAAVPELENLGSIPMDLSSWTLMLNAVYDFMPDRRISPYIGGGIGWAFHRLNFGGTNFTNGTGTGTLTRTDGDSNHFAANAVAGVSWKMRDGLFLDTGYRFSYLGDAEIQFDSSHGGGAKNTSLQLDDIMSHEFKLGLRYDLY